MSAEREQFPEHVYADISYYESIARDAEEGALHYRWRMRWLDELLDVQPGDRIIDIGSGAGTVSAHLARRGATVEAVDSSPVAVEFARRRWDFAGRVHFTVCDATHCEHLPSASWDKVTCCDIIEHVFDETMHGIFREAGRLLKPGGLLFVYSPNAGHWVEQLKAHNFILKEFEEHIRVRRHSEVVAALQECGFTVVRNVRPTSMLPVVKWAEALWKRLPIAPDLAVYRICLLARKTDAGSAEGGEVG